jgi:Tol biopolymer transport system component
VVHPACSLVTDWRRFLHSIDERDNMRASHFMAGALMLLALGTAHAQEKPWAKPRFATFGEGKDWIVLNVHDLSLRRLQIPGPNAPQNVSTTPDGRWIVFTAFDEQARNTLLFKWDGTAGSEPVKIGDSQGYHADPVVSHDGTRVFFSHHPLAGGPPGQHGPKATAQLYEVGMDGSALKALTDGEGCHLGPTAPRAERVYFIHTPCDGSRALAFVDRTTGKTGSVGPKDESSASDPVLSPDGQRVLYTTRNLTQATLKELSLKTGQVKSLSTFDYDMPKNRPQFAGRPGEFLYQNNGAIVLLKAGKTQHVAMLRGETP